MEINGENSISKKILPFLAHFIGKAINFFFQKLKRFEREFWKTKGYCHACCFVQFIFFLGFESKKQNKATPKRPKIFIHNVCCKVFQTM